MKQQQPRRLVPYETPDPPRLKLAKNRMGRDLCRCLMWIDRGECFVVDRDPPHNIIPIKLRTGQHHMFRVMLEQAVERLPVRIAIPKYRRHGMSTIVQALFWFMTYIRPNNNSQTVAHRGKSARTIFGITLLIHKRVTGRSGGKRGDSERRIKFENQGSKYECDTATGKFTSSGDTLHMLHVSEAAKIENTSDQDRIAMHSMTNAVAQNSTESIIVIESSGQGPHGMFPGMCRNAAKGKGEFRVVFISWLQDPAIPLDERQTKKQMKQGGELVGKELVLKKVYGAVDGQLAWRRKHLDTYFEGNGYESDPPEFLWDYPLTMEDCFGQRSGLVYPKFSVDRNSFDLKEMPIDMDPEYFPPEWKLYRAIDWGDTENHPFVCLWIAYDPSKKPQLIVHPSCIGTIEEFGSYCYDPKTGKPVKDKDHAMDALRYAVVTYKLRGMVYVYRELFKPDAAKFGSEMIARDVHLQSNWVNPEGPNSMNLKRFIPGRGGERYRGTVSDRARQGIIADFRNWGIKPLRPHIKPDEKDSSLGEVADGIGMVRTVVSGTAYFKSKMPDLKSQIRDRALAKVRAPRRQVLTPDEVAALKKATPSFMKKEKPKSEGVSRSTLRMARKMRRFKR